jgi:hypothetical protein
MFTIVWDVDDVLNNLMHTWFHMYWKLKHPRTALTYSDITKNTPEQILSLSKTEYLDSLDIFRLSQAYMDMKPEKLLIDWFEQYGSQARHIALTSVPLKAAHVSANWVLHHFGKWIRTFHFIPSFRENENIPVFDRSKKETLEWLGKVDVLVEDNEENIRDAEKLGINGMLVSRPWNNSTINLDKTLNALSKLIDGKVTDD